MRIVSDSGPILSFARAHRLDILHEVVRELVIPDAVYEEVVIQGAGKPGSHEVEQASWIKREQVRDHTFVAQLPQKLHIGERQAITLARELGGVLLVDEHEVRKEAQRMGVRHFGSLRVLKEAKDRKIIQEVKPILNELVAAGMSISDTLYQDFLREIGEG